MPHSRFLAFEDARRLAQSLQFHSLREWRQWATSGQKPPNIPSEPDHVYHEHWKDWPDWLGTTRRPRSHFLPFAEARAFVHTLGFVSQSQWLRYVRSRESSDTVPSSPKDVYKDEGWIDWADWLGVHRARRRCQWRSFDEARALVRAQGFPSAAQWEQWGRSPDCPNDIPLSPDEVYRNEGWQGFRDWLGKPPRTQKWLTFQEARAFVRTLGLKGEKEWVQWARSSSRPPHISPNPRAMYCDDGWAGLSDWLGTAPAQGSGGRFVPFEEARTFVRQQGVRSFSQWNTWKKTHKRPSFIPSDPLQVYLGKGWAGWHDFVGTTPETAPRGVSKAGVPHSRSCSTKSYGRPRRAFRPFSEARAFVRTLGLKGEKEWVQWARSGARPLDIPSHPDRIYRSDGWAGNADWMGYAGHWTQHAMYAHALSLKPVQRHVPPATLRAIFYSRNWPSALEAHYGPRPDFAERLRRAFKAPTPAHRRAAVCALLCAPQPVPDISASPPS